MSIRLEEEVAFDPEARRLCGDPACIGVVGDDGRCKECGRIGEGEEPHARHFAEDEGESDAEDEGESDADDSGDAIGPAAQVVQESARSDVEFDDRRLCGDPACLGVLSADGRCGECGRVFS